MKFIARKPKISLSSEADDGDKGREERKQEQSKKLQRRQGSGGRHPRRGPSGSE